MASKIGYVRLNDIRTNRVALRDVSRESESFMELMNSIRSQGVISSVSLRERPGEDGKKYELVDGLQRYTAACEIGTGVVDNVNGQNNPRFEEVTGPDGKPEKVGLIPAQIIERDDADTMVAQVIANAHRVETKPSEYAAAIVRYLGYSPTMTESELAMKLGKSPSWIQKTMSLNKLTDQAKALVDDNHISVANAYILAKLPPDEQLAWLDRAQTMKPEEFTAKALERAKEIRDANKKGRDAGEEVFTPVRHFRKKNEIEAEADKAVIGEALIRDLEITKDIKANAQGLQQAAKAGWQLALNWAMNYDPKSIEIQRKEDEERRASEKDTKVRRDAEKAAKKEKEAMERAAKAREEAEAARKEAAKLPPVPVAV